MLLKALKRAIFGVMEPGRQADHVARYPLLLGMASHLYDPRKRERVYLSHPERLKHLYILGATGSGKTKLIEFLIRQDIIDGRGICLLDAHGDLCNSILQYMAFLAQKHAPSFLQALSSKLIVIEPFNPRGSIGFNPLEIGRYSSFAQASELMGIFRKLWQDAHWGPRMEELLRNTFITLSENGLTLLEAPRLLTDQSFREMMIQGLKHEAAKEYWMTRYHALSDKMQALYREPVLNRLSVFTGDPGVRLMIGQSRSTIDFREIMDRGKWLIINLSKGQLRENAYLLGTLLIAKLKLAALSRAELPERRRAPFYVYVDEFQHYLGQDFETILSEARKYGLGLTLAHQNLDQIDRKLLASILGNVGTQVIFRLSHRDAALIAQEMDPKARPMIEKALIDFRVGQSFVKLRGEKPRMLRTIHLPSFQRNQGAGQMIKEISFANYARSPGAIEREIRSRQMMFFPLPEKAVSRPRGAGRAPGAMLEGWSGW